MGIDTGYDYVERVQRVANLIWNTSTLAWEKSTGGATPGANVAVTNFPETQPVSIAASVPVTGTFWQATQPVTISSALPVTGTFFQATQPVSAASLPLPSGAATEATLSTLDGKVTACNTGAVIISGTVPVSGTFWQATQPISGIVTANPATAYGKTITYVAVAQGAAGTTELAAASASNKHKIVGGMLTMSLAGTPKFTDGVADLTGPMTFAANGGMVVPESPVPFTQTVAVNRALNLVTTLGAANGVIAILTEP